MVLDRSALESLGDRVEIRELRVDPESGREFGVVSSMKVAVADAPATIHEDPLPEAVVRQWLLPAVYERLSTGRGEFLAELRPAYPLFVRFGGIDYDNDDDAIAKLDDFIRHAQRILTTYGGNLLHLTLGDKGAYLSAVFGPPQSRTRTTLRARRRPRSNCASSSPRRRSPASRSGSPTAGCAAERTATGGGRRSPASATRSISRRGSCRTRRRARSMCRNRCVARPASSSLGSSSRRSP